MRALACAAVGAALGAALGTTLGAGAAQAELARVDTPQGRARVEGSPFEAGERLVIGDRVALADPDHPQLWIEAHRGSLLLALGSGGTACPALWTWLDAGDPGFCRTEAFGIWGAVAGAMAPS